MKTADAIAFITSTIPQVRKVTSETGCGNSIFKIFVEVGTAPRTSCPTHDGACIFVGETLDPRILEAWIAAVYLPIATADNLSGWGECSHPVNRRLIVDVYADMIGLRVGPKETKK